jgi:HSP20 family protein
MRHPYEELLRQMEHDASSSSELFWRFLHAVAPDKFWEPPVDIYETRDALKIKVEIPGARREDISVELAGDGRSVTIRGLRLDGDPDMGDRTVFYQMEIYTGAFERIIGVPTNLSLDRSAVHASYEGGFLIITLPKRTAPQPSRMEIRIKG